MKTLITGGAGFVGNYLIDCIKSSFDTEIFVSKLENETVKDVDGVTFFNMDITKDITNFFIENQFSHVFHLAAQSSVALSWKEPSMTVDVNIKGTLNLLEAIRNSGYSSKVLLVGSSEEYGLQNTDPISEKNVPYPQNIYAVTKACQNMIGSIYSKAYGMHVVSTRAFNHIGPKQSPIFVVSDFCKQVALIEAGLKDPVIYVGNISAKRDFSDVRDIVRAYCMLINSGKSGETYNIGSGTAISVEEILNKILALSSKNINIKVDPNKLRPVDVLSIEADCTKIKNLTAWNPKISIDETLRDTLDYWRNNGLLV